NGERDRLYAAKAGLVERRDKFVWPLQRTRKVPAPGEVGGGIERGRGVPEDPLINQPAYKIPHCGGNDSVRARDPAHAAKGSDRVRHEVESKQRKASIKAAGREIQSNRIAGQEGEARVRRSGRSMSNVWRGDVDAHDRRGLR